MQLFVYLFIPILKSIKSTDLDNLKLNNGLKIWEPLWSYRQPDIEIFNTPVKKKVTKISVTIVSSPIIERKEAIEKKRLSVDKKQISKVPLTITTSSNNYGDIYMGAGGIKTEEATTTTYKADNKKESQVISLMPKSASCLEKLVINENNNLDKDTFFKGSEQHLKSSNLTAPNINKDESDSIQVSEFGSDTIRDSSTILNKGLATSRAPIVHMSSVCNFSDSFENENARPNKFFFKQNSFNNNIVETTKQEKILKLTNKQTSVTTEVFKGNSNISKNTTTKDLVKLATYFDVAVIRCMLSPKWHTEGYLWALEYLNYRVTDLTDTTLKEQFMTLKNKSSSYPMIDNEKLYNNTNTQYQQRPERYKSSKLFKHNEIGGLENEFVNLINQLNLESNFSSRTKYDNNFHYRIR